VLHLRGPYGKAEGEAITKLFSWVGEQGFAPAGPPRVTYFHDPAGTEPEDQICRVEVPLAGK
jgi:DNA gyrase inhibitor GyrI